MAKICPSCGFASGDENRFCIQCGTPLSAPSEKPVLHEAPRYSVNAVRPAESHYTSPTQTTYQPPVQDAPTFAEPAYGYGAPVQAQPKKRRGLLIGLTLAILVLLGVIAYLGFTQGKVIFENHQLDGAYRLTGFISGGKDYSASVDTIGEGYALTVSGSDCTLQLGEGNVLRLQMDPQSGTLSNASSEMRYTVREHDGVPSISVSSEDAVMTFTRN